MKRRRILAGALAAFVAVGTVVATAGPAQAGLLGDCLPGVPDGKDAPTPTRPDNGMANFWAIPPGKQVEDPFKEGATTSIIDQYGFAGLEWPTYDLGCGGAIADPIDAGLTAFANGLMQGPINGVGFTAGVSFVAKQPGILLEPLKAPLRAMSRAIMEHPYTYFLPLSVMAIALGIAFKRKSQTSEVAGIVGFLLIVVVSSTVLVAIPLVVVDQLDWGQATVLGEVDKAVGNGSGTMAGVGSVHHTVLYDTWCAGTVGDSGSTAAKRWCPALFRATAYTYQEWQDAQTSGKRQTELRDQKQAEFKRLADEIKTEDPDAYANLQGKRPWNRIMHALMQGWLLGFGVCFFTVCAAVVAINSMIKIRFAVLAWPAAAPIGVLPAHRGIMFTILDKTVYAVGSAVLFTFAAGLNSLFMGALMASEWPMFLKVLLSLTVTIVAYTFLIHSRAKGFMRLIKKAARYLATKHAVEAGVRDGTRDKADGQQAPAAALSPPPLPPPPTITEPGHPGYVVYATERNAPPALASGTPALEAGPHRYYTGPVRERGPIDAERVIREDGSEVYEARPRTEREYATTG
jgi:hypothetical protein